MGSDQVTRRTLLRGAAGGAVLLGSAGLPAWARQFTATTAGIRRPDSRPFPHLPVGHRSMPEIEHIVVLMMENHSFDNLLGMVPYEVPGRALVDGLTRRNGMIANFNLDATGNRIYATPAPSPCQLPAHPSNSWNSSHEAYANGANSGFVTADLGGPIAMNIWDQQDLPFTYSLVRHFPIGQRYFSSVMAKTYPNRRYLFASTSSGVVDDKIQTLTVPVANGTIWDRLDHAKVSWRVYDEGVTSFVIVPGSLTPARAFRIKPMTEFYGDAARGKLPAFTFLEPNYATASEENPQDIQVGEQFVAGVVNALIHGRKWHKTALFITYDEHGGYYDHVPPPSAIAPDSIAPMPSPGQAPLLAGGFDRYGFRVPLIVVSPWAKKSYVSRVVQDHTSITAFIERKWNLPAMTFRDANAHPMTDYFDFSKCAFAKPPKLAAAPGLAAGLAQCSAQGLAPPM
jgi:phospholipase C